jgi:hypothetical protein
VNGFCALRILTGRLNLARSAFLFANPPHHMETKVAGQEIAVGMIHDLSIGAVQVSGKAKQHIAALNTQSASDLR